MGEGWGKGKIHSMLYLIDGHNLIPKLGLRLDNPDDEIELVAILQEFARLKRHEVNVFFDGAPAGSAGTRKMGNVQAHFVRIGQTADAAIRARLHRMGRNAKNCAVVSSDREVLGAARAAQAEGIASEEFVKMLKQVRQSAPKPSSERNISSREVEEWMELFKRGKDEK